MGILFTIKPIPNLFKFKMCQALDLRSNYSSSFINNINPQQYGFRQGKSTTHVTNLIHECIKHNHAQGYKTAILSKDVQKAFDTVWHSGLIWKIHHKFNLPMPMKKLLTNFLHDRTVKLKHNNYTSHSFNPSAGVPQGSALSPTLYTMYVHTRFAQATLQRFYDFCLCR